MAVLQRPGTKYHDAGPWAYYCFYNSIINIFVTIAGLIGVNKNKPGWLIPYIIFCAISLAGLLLIMVITLLFSSWFINSDIFDEVLKDTGVDDHTIMSLKKTLPVLVMMLEVTGLIVFAISAYFTIVVYSYYIEMSQLMNTAGAIYSVPPDQSAGYPPIATGYPQMEAAPPYNPSYPTEKQFK